MEEDTTAQAAKEQDADVIAFVDEAGARGYVRNLTQGNDAEISVLSALPIPAVHLELVRECFRPAYDRFCAAAPPGAKLHITDAFRSENAAWGEVSRSVREEIFNLMKAHQLRVVYVARRLRLAREAHELQERIRADAREASNAKTTPKTHVIPGADRPSDEQVDDQLMIDLSLVMDAFVETAEAQKADFYFDEIDEPVADRYRAMIETARHISYVQREVAGWNLAEKKSESRFLHMWARADFNLDAQHVGAIAVVGKSDPLVFVADVVANSLWRHLAALPADATLNDGRGLAGWGLEPVTFYDRIHRQSLMDLM